MDGIRGRLLVVVVVLLAAALSAQARPVPSSGADDAKATILTVKPGKLAGTVVYPDGKTLAAKSPVRIWSVEKQKFVYEGATDEHGAYALPELPEGRYIAIFGDRMRVEMVVDETKGTFSGPLKVVIPRGTAQLTRRQIATRLTRVGSVYPAGSGTAFLGKSWLVKGAVIAAGGTAAAAGVAAATDSSSSHHHRGVVSP